MSGSSKGFKSTVKNTQLANSAAIIDNNNFAKITFETKYDYKSKPKVDGYQDRNKIKDPLSGDIYFTKREIIQLLKDMALGSLDDPLIMRLFSGAYAEFPENKKPQISADNKPTVKLVDDEKLSPNKSYFEKIFTANKTNENANYFFDSYLKDTSKNKDYIEGLKFPFLAPKDKLNQQFDEHSQITQKTDATNLINKGFNNGNNDNNDLGDVYFGNHIVPYEIYAKDQNEPYIRQAITLFKVYDNKIYRFLLLFRPWQIIKKYGSISHEHADHGQRLGFKFTFRGGYSSGYSLSINSAGICSRANNLTLSDWIWTLHIIDKQKDILRGSLKDTNSLYQHHHKSIDNGDGNAGGSVLNMSGNNDLPIYERINNVKVLYKDYDQ